MKCPTCNQEIKKDNESEYVSMIEKNVQKKYIRVKCPKCGQSWIEKIR